ncbi:MAG TPA: acetolactate synthase, partial [Acidimicrobiales bacterium]|nr:acetolactate synthase [Acidimicrobiales bacterium]
MTVSGHSGELAMTALGQWGVSEIFTLSGGHVFPIYDACVKTGVRIVDVRHEQSAVFAAEAVAKLARRPGVAVLTAGPGVTNGISAITTAQFNGSPILIVGGRAPQGRWGSGSLQEIDHLPIVDSITKFAATAKSPQEVFTLLSQAATQASTPSRGPAFVDIPIDVIFSSGEIEGSENRKTKEDVVLISGQQPDTDRISDAVTILSNSSRPALIAGGDVWMGRAEMQLKTLVENQIIPTFMNGQGRGCLPADHELAFSRTRPALKECDVVCVVGTPLDFRLSFGSFGGAQVIHVVDSTAKRATHATTAVSIEGDLATCLHLLVEGLEGSFTGSRATERREWVSSLRDRETSARQVEKPLLESSSNPIHPMRIFGELAKAVDRDAIVIGDGGDFVSFAGKLVESYNPGCWLDPGPYGCLGTGLGYIAGARIVHPDRQIVALMGDGAFGFSAMDVDTLVRNQ